ncbi:hypothetical protein GQ457_15G010350 [Hibiscus cannabinus]
MLLFHGNATPFSSSLPKSQFDFSDTPAAGPRDTRRNGSGLAVVDEANDPCSFSVTLLVNKAAHSPTTNNPKKIESRTFMVLQRFARGSDGLEPSELETGRNGLVSTIVDDLDITDEKKGKQQNKEYLALEREIDGWLSMFEELGSDYYIRAVAVLRLPKKLVVSISQGLR